MTLMTVLAIAVVLGLIVVQRFVSTGKVPPEKGFRCSKCGNYAAHDDRTIKAWRNDKHKFFCRSCHRDWLAQNEGRSRPSPTAGPNTGCLVVFAAPILLGTAAIFVARWISRT